MSAHVRCRMSSENHLQNVTRADNSRMLQHTTAKFRSKFQKWLLLVGKEEIWIAGIVIKPDLLLRETVTARDGRCERRSLRETVAVSDGRCPVSRNPFRIWLSRAFLGTSLMSRQVMMSVEESVPYCKARREGLSEQKAPSAIVDACHHTGIGHHQLLQPI